MAQTKQQILTARQATSYLGISLSTLRKIEREGLLVPFRTPGGHRRYNLKMLVEYLEASRQTPAKNTNKQYRTQRRRS